MKVSPNLNRRDFLAAGSAAALAAFALRGWAAPAGPRRLRVAQIGTAHAHAAEKWATLQRFPEHFAVAGLCEPDPALRAKAAGQEEYRGAAWLAEEELFSRDDLDAVLVETELPDLLRYGERAIARGWHLHLDKPPGRDLAAWRRLQAAAAAARRVLQPGYMYRYHPALRFCLEAQERGWLGEILAIHGDIGKVIGPARRPWLAEHYGGSMLLLGCHLIDLTVALMGAPASVTTHRRRSFPERDAFSDHEVAVLGYPRGLATIRSLLAEVGGDDRRQLVVCGENATLEVTPLEPARLRVAFQRPPAGFRAGYQDVPLPAVAGRYDEQLLDFAAMAQGQPSRLPRFDAAHDALVQDVLLRAAGA
ncbi:MAG: Gfo/Idh/MocA family oxidoreductase [Opitutaceae bacterium]|nr:Gfo/Idh/MocA family oxidoreductase [Opitutaceae bacterium]